MHTNKRLKSVTTQVHHSLHHLDLWELENKEQTKCAIRAHLSECIRGDEHDLSDFAIHKGDGPMCCPVQCLKCFLNYPVSAESRLGQMSGQCVRPNPGKGFFSGGVHQSHRSHEDNSQGRSATQWRPRKIEV